MEIEITKKELELLMDLSRSITAVPSEDPLLFREQSEESSLFLPDRIWRLLYPFSKNGSDTGFLLIKTGINDDKTIVPRTPDNNHSYIGEKTTLAKINGMFLYAIAEMVAYEAEGNGKLFQDIIPIQIMEHLQISISSRIELELHTEQAFSKVRPDILSLACLRGDKEAITYILPVRILLQYLSSKEIALLREPLWKIDVDLSFKEYGKEFIEGEIRGPIPILYGSIEDPFLTFDQDLIFGMTEESEKIIYKIIDLYYEHRISYNLQEGDLLWIDNRRAVHGRSPFSARYDGYDRFLVRSFAVYDYEKIKYACPVQEYLVSAIYS